MVAHCGPDRSGQSFRPRPRFREGRGVNCAPSGFDQRGLLLKMPRACPVEGHAGRYTSLSTSETGCHGLGPWRFTLPAK
jgi:hypothetical protein